MITVIAGKERYTCKVEGDTKVVEVKEQLEPLTGVPIKGQRLLVKGKEREDSLVLSSIGIKEGSKVMLLFTKEYQVREFSKHANTPQEKPLHQGISRVNEAPPVVDITVGEGDSVYAVLKIKSGSKEHVGRYHVKCMSGEVTMESIKAAIGRVTNVRAEYMRLLAKGKEVDGSTAVKEVTAAGSSLEMLMLFKYGYHMQVEGSEWLKQRQGELDALKAKLDRMENSLSHRGGDLAEFVMKLRKLGELVGSYLESVDHVTVNDSLMPEMKQLKEDLLAADRRVKELNSRVPLV
ncbi:hypothetical protein FOL47_003762 [Perkinsus chesapeaki]|uniref:Ubiquitin-like domain-containing protein n=1 Tax=Perkinsus chesapeaki TaxID=330153 RepID=A0A7J6MZG9_PERCH|nr:hypothetical protein FOL47_003762 [Perkinsus chesapeaki]